MIYKNSFLGFALISLMLTGCSEMRGQLGLKRESPDEFAVLTRAPLEMPTSVNLPMPVPGQPRPQEQATIDQAREAVFGQVMASGKTSSNAAETMLLQKAGAAQIEPNIRATVNTETKELDERNKPVIEKITGLGIAGGASKSSATVVDAKAELARIQKTVKQGQVVTGQDSVVTEE